jgi:hypothetical protein
VWQISLVMITCSFATFAVADPLPYPLSYPSPSPTPTANIGKSPRKKFREQKETEGSEAPGRFEANTIIKSEYQLNGQPLEVDPD